ncbi:MAG: polyphenol oxidase family protein [Muribaculaceae bacterium]|nr:polyphenol oxidase family protein [Muribaculaceae bacterium]
MNFEFTALLTAQAPEVTALVTHRGFNACWYAGADAASSAEGRRLIARYFGVGDDAVFMPRQTHSVRVAYAGEDLDGVDALVTSRRGAVLCINTADCLPLLLVDTVAGVIGAAHCGWRGTVAGIASRTVERMAAIGADPSRIVAAMGPCICPACFEVGPEVAARFPAEVLVESSGGRPHVDLGAAVSLQLLASGLRHDSISLPMACSMHDSRFHSVRREGRDLPYRTLSAIILNQ